MKKLEDYVKSANSQVVVALYYYINKTKIVIFWELINIFVYIFFKNLKFSVGSVANNAKN